MLTFVKDSKEILSVLSKIVGAEAAHGEASFGYEFKLSNGTFLVIGQSDDDVADEHLFWIKQYKHENEIVNLRKAYFAFRDKLHAEGNTGYSKVELHELAKKYIFPKLIENPDNFIEGGKDQSQFSVTWLSEQGWKSYVEEFKLFAAENFNFYL